MTNISARRWIIAILALFALSAATLPQRYIVDPAGSSVSAKVGFFGIGSKTAVFPKMSGTAEISPDRVQDLTIDVTLDARALTAPDSLTLSRLRGEKFFWVKQYPTVRFIGSGMVMTGERSGKVNGKLTARGVTKPVVLSLVFDQPPAAVKPGDVIGITGETTIDRRDFGMTSYSLIVGKKVDISLKVRMVPR